MISVLRYHHPYALFFILFFLLTMFHHAFSISANTLLATESLTISSNRTIVSPGDVFELGFFTTTSSPSGDERWYLGIWYKKDLERIYVWIANRDKPLSNSTGTLKISYNNLILFDQVDTPVWSTNLTRRGVKSPIVAELLSNGNFVLRYSTKTDADGFLWQSFDYPTDTLLPEMKLGWDLKTGLNRFLTSWKSRDDPSSGNYSYKLETRGFPEFLIWVEEIPVYRSGPWNGIQFSGISDMRQVNYTGYNLTKSKEEVTYTFLVTNRSLYSRVRLNPGGYVEGFTWIPRGLNPNLYWFSPMEQCDGYQKCGRYSYCNFITSFCNCIRGFVPKNPQAWELKDGSNGCVRKTPLRCGRDGFFRLKNMKLPDARTTIVDRIIGLKDCAKRCRTDCNCTAYAPMDIRNGELGCVMWTGELLDLRNFGVTGQDLYVKLADADLDKENNKSGIIIGLSIGAILLLFLGLISFFFWKRKRKQARATAAPTDIGEDFDLPLMEFDVISKATNDFSNMNKLGQGGFGAVYKGRLFDGEEIAVKRLSEVSSQGSTEFTTEMKLIAKLQHINLVRLLGCYADAKEKMLVYEYLENLSLDYFIFDKIKSCKLDWQRRFDIIKGIARGLLYLHQDSRCRVIHRDLKASNILLDKDMIPKISDFGMARIFARDTEEATTRRIVGTYGYMSPEYAMDGKYSIKSDIFSFGVLLLEIISGMKNRGFYNSDLDRNLLSYAWRNWTEGNGLEFVDSVIKDSSSSPSPTFRPQEILRCIQIGLLCVQDQAEDRPTTSSVVMMLGSETAEIPQPQPPGYCLPTSNLESDSSSSSDWTVNEATFSVIEAR